MPYGAYVDTPSRGVTLGASSTVNKIKHRKAAALTGKTDAKKIKKKGVLQFTRVLLTAARYP